MSVRESGPLLLGQGLNPLDSGGFVRPAGVPVGDAARAADKRRERHAFESRLFGQLTPAAASLGAFSMDTTPLQGTL
jgi:hypothetical protein